MSEKSIEKLKLALDCDLTDYQSIPFWSWNNELDEGELQKQIEDMKAAGIGGFIMHARTGLKTEYLGEKWFSCIKACLDKARELNMNAWVYDENGWPSGFVGGKMLENHAWRARFLEYKVTDSFDGEAFCVFEKTDCGFVRLYEAKDGLSEYHCVYLCVSPANTDILDPEVVDEFIKETHEEYYKRFADSFGRELVGFFTDEPQYYRWGTPYTPVAAPIFTERYGEDIRDGLVYLFVEDEHGYVFRERYYQLLNELYVNNFYKKIYDWCTAHNCKLTGHSIEEQNLRGQMMGGAGVMPTYEYEHVPAIDCLGRNCQSEIPGKQIGSVCSQMGIKQILTETFACCGFDVTPKELKSVAEFQYFNGVNLMCQHLYPYSFAAQGKYDHPPVFSKHGNWFDEFKSFNDYFTRLGFIVANTTDHYDVLIVHPMRDIYLDHVLGGSNEGNKQTEAAFKELLLALRRRGITYHFADEKMLQKYGKNEEGELVIGKCRYNTVILPVMRTISASTLELLEGFGGKLHVVGAPELIDGAPAKIELESNISIEEIAENAKFNFNCPDGLCGLTARSGEIGDYVFIKNYSRTEDSHISMKGIAENYRMLDLDTMTLKPISNEMTVGKCGGLVFIKDEEAADTYKTETVEDITASFKVTDVTDNYLVIDNISISYDGKTFGETLPVQRHFEDLLRADYKGKLFVKHTFKVADVVPMKVILERESFLSVTSNGVELTLSDNDFEINFVEADITDTLKVGENEIVYSLDYYQHDGVHFALFDPLATESLRNCLYYDTNIENIYIQGDFTVDEDHIIHRRESLPELSSDNYKKGYPFFKGEVTLRGSYNFDGKGERTLSLDKGRFLVAEVTINGKKTDITMDTKRDVTDMLSVGENQIEIILKSSLRNLFGPHHWADNPEPSSVSPIHFTMRGSWNGGITERYTPVYNSVPFGVDAIEMIIS